MPRKMLPSTQSADAEDLAEKVFKEVDAKLLTGFCLIGVWLSEQEVGSMLQLTVDGKVLRDRSRQDGQPLQLLSAVTHHLR